MTKPGEGQGSAWGDFLDEAEKVRGADSVPPPPSPFPTPEAVPAEEDPDLEPSYRPSHPLTHHDAEHRLPPPISGSTE